MHSLFRYTALASVAMAAACATVPVTGDPAVTVVAAGETAPVETAAGTDAADDPAIWRNPENPADSLIVGTDKKAGLHLYDMNGKGVDFDPGGKLNNVDLVSSDLHGVIVAASDRNDPLNARMRVYRLNTAARKLELLGEADAGKGEAYGFCMAMRGDDILAYSALKDGTVREFRLDVSQGTAVSIPLRTMKLPTQIEGCVVDPRDGTLYVGEEDVGIWRFATGSTEGTMFAPVDNKMLVADVEGLAIMPEGESGGYLVASSQGDSAYAVYQLDDGKPVGRFRIAAGKFGAVEETDGIDLVSGSFGPGYPQGLFVAQDGQNAPAAQNFKLVSWADILEALGR
ncbi:phytase [Tsuneonella flava]|uniref:Phytase n=1 Tax=Tsuneonella flava TaxID=2055955 RepID=A0ABX7KC64_9SPHN|nr:phytase [Tsuneonella flava]QSB45604.1 phytase [Tsuneonella flava]